MTTFFRQVQCLNENIVFGEKNWFNLISIIDLEKLFFNFSHYENKVMNKMKENYFFLSIYGKTPVLAELGYA